MVVARGLEFEEDLEGTLTLVLGGNLEMDLGQDGLGRGQATIFFILTLLTSTSSSEDTNSSFSGGTLVEGRD